jgi:hypothetical protein
LSAMKPFDTLLMVHPSAAIQRIGLEQTYHLAQSCSLPEQAPEEIRELWTQAQHLLAYSGLEYPFVVVADLLCGAVVEAALRKECEAEIEAVKAARLQQGKAAGDVKFSEVLKMFKGKLADSLSEQEPPTQSLMMRTSEWLGAYYEGTLKEYVGAWIEYSDAENGRIKVMFEEIRQLERVASSDEGHTEGDA